MMTLPQQRVARAVMIGFCFSLLVLFFPHMQPPITITRRPLVWTQHPAPNISKEGFWSDSSLPWWDQINLTDCSIFNNVGTDGEAKKKAVERLIRSESRLEINGNYSTMGHCGVRAWLQGSLQNVVSYSLYGTKVKYTVGLPFILPDITKMYPGYKARIHTDPRGRYELFCPLLVKHRHLFICDTTRLPSNIDASKCDPMLWRTLPFGDPQVERVNIRDTDSTLNEREVAAVNAWVESGKPLHLMRDHPQHTVLVMGGMFGIYQTPALLPEFDRIRKALFIRGKGNDQTNLAMIMPKKMIENSVQHDSFQCQQFPGSVAFPTQRVDGYFVASRLYFMNETINQPCPAECRPPQHQDWTYC